MGQPSSPLGRMKEGTWARLPAGRKLGASPAPHSGFLPSRKVWSGGPPGKPCLGPEPPGVREAWSTLAQLASGLPSGLGQLAWPPACQASSFPSLWEFGAWVGGP